MLFLGFSDPLSAAMPKTLRPDIPISREIEKSLVSRDPPGSRLDDIIGDQAIQISSFQDFLLLTPPEFNNVIDILILRRIRLGLIFGITELLDSNLFRNNPS